VHAEAFCLLGHARCPAEGKGRLQVAEKRANRAISPKDVGNEALDDNTTIFLPWLGSFITHFVNVVKAGMDYEAVGALAFGDIWNVHDATMAGIGETR